MEQIQACLCSSNKESAHPVLREMFLIHIWALFVTEMAKPQLKAPKQHAKD